MAAEVGPNLGLTSHFGNGANGWDGAMDANLDMLDAVVNTAVLSMTKTAPPANPAAGDRYIVAAGGTGAWANKDNALTVYRDGGWVFYTPKTGLRVFDLETAGFHFYSNAWAIEAGGFADAPNDGKLYARQNGQWVVVTTSGGGDADAPSIWGITIQTSASPNYCSLEEIEFRSKAGVAEQASGGAGHADRSYFGANDVNYLFDGVNQGGGRFASGQPYTGNRIWYTFPSGKAVKQVAVYNAANSDERITGFDIITSSDGGATFDVVQQVRNLDPSVYPEGTPILVNIVGS